MNFFFLFIIGIEIEPSPMQIPTCAYMKENWHIILIMWHWSRQIQTSNCCLRLNASPASMSFSRASFSLKLLSLCTSSWAALSSLSNLQPNTHKPLSKTNTQMKHSCCYWDDIIVCSSIYLYIYIYSYISIYIDIGVGVYVWVQTSSASSPDHGCGSVGPPGEVLCPAVQLSVAGFSSSAVRYFAGIPHYLPASHWSAQTNHMWMKNFWISFKSFLLGMTTNVQRAMHDDLSSRYQGTNSIYFRPKKMLTLSQ